MALSNRKNPIRSLLLTLPRGGPIDTSTLRGLGVSAALASHYVGAGWLERLGRGVFKFPNDELLLASCLDFFAIRIPDFHVAGKTALAWRGFRHNVGSRERLHVWGGRATRLPDWFVSRFPVIYTSRQIFDASFPSNIGLAPLPEAPGGVGVSVPERALLEMLSDVGLGQSVEEARNIMENIRSVRLDVLGKLLKHCPRVKIVRLCVQWAEELNLPWAPDARQATGERGKGRWLTRLPDGTTLILKP